MTSHVEYDMSLEKIADLHRLFELWTINFKGQWVNYHQASTWIPITKSESPLLPKFVPS